LSCFHLEALVAICCLAVILCGCSSKPIHDKAADSDKTPVPPSTERPSAVVDDRPVIVALGDSLTAGLGVALTETYPAKLQAKIDAGGFRYRVVNAGVSGDTSSQGLNRLSALRELHPEIVIVALGANDGLRGLPVSETQKNLEAIITELKQDEVTVVLAGMMIPPNFGLDYTTAFRQVFKDLATKHRLPLIPFLLEGVGGRAQLNQDDGIHPTSEGYDIVAQNVWRVLRPLLRKA
jgi:acyl-CoA thioesterase-1